MAKKNNNSITVEQVIERLQRKVDSLKSNAQSEMKDFAKKKMSHSLGLSTGADWASDQMNEWLNDPMLIVPDKDPS